MNGWAGTFQLRRLNNAVYTSGILDSAAATEVQLCLVLAGFRSSTYQALIGTEGTSNRITDTVVMVQLQSPGNIWAPVGASNLRVFDSWVTDDPWPVVLP